MTGQFTSGMRGWDPGDEAPARCAACGRREGRVTELICCGDPIVRDGGCLELFCEVCLADHDCARYRAPEAT